MKTSKFIKKSSFVALCLLSQMNVFGQDSLSVQVETETTRLQDTLSLNLDQAIKIALDQNPTIKVAGMEITKANYAKKEAVSGLFPSIIASGTYTRNLKKQVMNFAGQTVTIGTDNTWNAGFSATLPLINVPLWQSIKLTSEAVMEKVEKARSSQITQVSTIIAAYYGILNAQDSYNVLEKSFNTANENLRITKKRFEQGMTSEYDVIQAEVQVRNIQPTLISIKNGIELATLQLKVLMSMPSDYPIKVEGSLADYTQEAFEEVNINEVDTTLSENPNIRLLDVNTTLLERQLKLAKANWYPMLSLSAVYQWTSMNDNFDFGNYQVNPYSTLGVTLSWPIFQGGARVYKQKQAQIALEEIEYTKEDTRRKLGMQLESSIDNIKVAVDQIESTKQAMVLAEKGLNISRKRYEVGSGSSLELITSENSLTQASLSYYQAIYNYIIAKNSMNEVLGNAYNQYLNNK
ncbi:MAG: TolC family protein [Paludibacteraceae bacterium]|nr:TolC family protein [Paludibacteraceae bacterium]